MALSLAEILSPDFAAKMDAQFKADQSDFASLIEEDNARFKRNRARRIARNIQLFGDPDANKGESI
jgi:hypothetical protein